MHIIKKEALMEGIMTHFDKKVFAANWPTFRGFFQNKWDQMTEEDFEKAEGDIDQLIQIWEKRYGLGREKYYSSLMEIKGMFK